MEKLNFAVIGCGSFGLKRVNALRSIEEANLVCVVDLDKAVAEKVAKELSVDCYDNYKEALQRKDIDCVVVAVPNKFHYEITIKALENRKHVLCEKPLAKTPEEAKRMVDVGQQNGFFLKTGSNHRYFPSISKTKELVDKNEIGKILRIRGQIGNNGERIKNTWYWDKNLAGGGTFLDNGCHLLDISRWLMGEFVECIGSVLNKYWSTSTLEDYGIGLFKTADNRIAVIESSWTMWSGYMNVDIIGTKGFIHTQSGKIDKTVLGKKNGSVEETYDFSNLSANVNKDELRYFIKAINEKRQPTASGYDGYKVVDMAHAIYKSSKTGSSVKL